MSWTAETFEVLGFNLVIVLEWVEEVSRSEQA